MDEHNQLSTWGTQKDCCRWKRVYCDSLTGHVTQLHRGAPLTSDWLGEHLPFNGKVSPKIIELEHLEYLDLSYNHFNKSQVPALICSLSNLQHLDLSNNEISGSRIPELIGNLTNLRYLDLSSNSLGDAFPYHRLGNLTHLHYLNLRYNYLTHGVELLKTVSHLSSLEYLHLSWLNLSTASDWVKTVSNLPNLRNLTLRSCDLPPPILPAYSHMNSSNSLVSVDLSNNDPIGSSIFNWLCNYINATLEYLDLSFTGYYGHQLPYQIGYLTRLRKLVLWDNDFTHAVEFFPSLTHLSSLEYLDLSQSTFNHSSVFDWADTLNQLSNLQVVKLSGCQLPPPIISTTTLSDKNTSQSLAYVDLYDNNITSLVFKWLSTYNTSTLDYLDLSYNKLSGSLPDVLGSMGSLTQLSLGGNQLEGMIPKSVWNMSKLESLDLSSNNLEGVISETHFSKRSKLEFLDLSKFNLTTLAQKGDPNLTISHDLNYNLGIYAQMSGSYDEEISIVWKGVLSEYKSTVGLVKMIDFSSNRLTGEIPVEITQLLGLVSLNLAGNHLTGQISPEIGKLKSLDSLDLSRNQISGSIPPSLLQIHGLGYLDLSYNNLSGKIPIGLQLQSYEASSFVGNRQLCGIPLAACNSEGTDQPNAPSVEEDPDDGLISRGFYISLGLGFAVGFWGVCGSLIFKRSWRYAYYNFLNASSDRLYVRVALIKQRLKDMYTRQL